MKRHRMNVKELKEFLNQFPEDAMVCTETSNHYCNADGIRCATLIDTKYHGNILFIGNTNQWDSVCEKPYNFAGAKILKKVECGWKE